MIEMRDSSRALLKKKYPELLQETNLDRFLLNLDAIITRDGLDNNDAMTAYGYSLQAIYDEIYMCNE